MPYRMRKATYFSINFYLQEKSQHNPAPSNPEPEKTKQTLERYIGLDSMIKILIRFITLKIMILLICLV